MKTKKIFYLMVILLITASIITVVIAKINIKKTDYSEYEKTSLYCLIPENEYKDMYDIKDIPLHTSFEDLSTLLSHTEAVLVITPIDTPTFAGDGILNNCKIKKVIQAENLEENQVIEIYDFITWWRMSDTNYLNGSTPLKINNDYLVFIRKAPRPNKQNTYIYSSIPYGHIKISDSIDVLENYEQASITINQAMNYQFIFDNQTDTNLINLYKRNCEQILSKYNFMN